MERAPAVARHAPAGARVSQMAEPGPLQGQAEQALAKLLAQEKEPGVAQAVATYEAVERIYFGAVAATLPPVPPTSYATATAPR